MALKALVISILVVEVYLRIGGLVFYWVEFSDFTHEEDKDASEKNLTHLLEKYKQETGKQRLLQ